MELSKPQIIEGRLVLDDEFYDIKPTVLREAREFIPRGMAKVLYINMPLPLRFRFIGEAIRRKCSTTGLFRDIFIAWTKYRYIPKTSYEAVNVLRKVEALQTITITLHNADRIQLKEAAKAAGVTMTVFVSALIDRELPSVEQVASSIYHELSPQQQSVVR